MKKIIVSLLIISFGFLVKSCNTTEPPPDGDKPTLELTLEDVSCTEAWIELRTTNLQLPTTVTLKQTNPTGDTKSQILNLNTQDSLLYIDSLLPNQTYVFQAVIQTINQSSYALTVSTMDTTSHNFTWQTWEFGEHSSSVLYDVAIINENNILAVGEIYMNDSLGQLDPQPYGVAIWDGQMWELKKIFHNTNIPVTPRGILVINPNEIYLAAGSVFRWGGASPTVQMVFSRLNLPDPNATIEKLWGNSSSSIYAVGNVGSIVFYNGTIWQRIESGTELNVNDVWGDYNEKTGEWDILAVASNIFSSFEKVVIKINHLNSQILSRDGIDETLSSVWFKANIKYYVVGSGTYKKNKLSDTIWEGDPLDITNYFENRIRANDINDVFVAGAFGELLHFNGVRWKSYLNETGLFSGAYLSADIKNNIQIAVGYEAAQAKIIVGNRE